MKNKLVTKIIMVAVCVSTLLVTLVVPSFAYSLSNASAIYNDKGELFNLPGYNVINLKNVTAHTDIPDILSYPVCDYYDGRGVVGVGGFISTINNTPLVGWYADKSIGTVNYYESGYYQSADIRIGSATNRTLYPFNYYELDSIVLRDYSFASPDDVKPGATCAIELDLHNPELFEQFSGVADGTVYSLKVNYSYKYYRENGKYKEMSFDTKIYPQDVGNGIKRVSIQYFPERYYVNLGEGFITDDMALNPIYWDDLVYLEELVITIDMEGYDINFMNEVNDSVNTLLRSSGHYTNRLNPSSSGSPTDLIEGAYDLGYGRGESDGFSDGFQSAVDQGELNPFENVLNMINTFINWEFIPGVSIGVVLSIVIGVSLLIAFLKIFAGG